MRNNRGQALVEFIIILPIFLLLIMAVIDFGNIISKKYALENDIDIITDMYREESYEDINNYVSKRDISIQYSVKGNMLTINLSKDINIISPALVIIFGDDYKISVEKSLYKNE